MIYFLFSPLLRAQNKYKEIPIANKKVAINQDLSQGRITDILEDERGFMWFATIDGLNRYDGYDVKIFRHKDGDSTSISNNQINKLVEDKNGFIWIATIKGLNKFDPYREIFHHFDCNISDKGTPEINDVVIDAEQNVWFGTQKGLFFIEAGKSRVEHIPLDVAFFPVQSLFIDSDHHLWIGNDGKTIKRYSLSTKLLKHYSFPFNQSTLYSGVVMHEDKNKRIWFSLFVNSNPENYINTYYFDLGGDRIKQFVQFEESIVAHNLYGSVGNVGCFTSRDNELWVASNTNSITKFDLKNNEVVYYPEFHRQHRHTEIGKTDVYFDSRGLLWFGTTGEGAYILPEGVNDFNLVNIDLHENLTVKSIRSFCEDSDYYWFSGYFGIAKMNKINGLITNINSSLPAYTLDNYPEDPRFLLVGSEGRGLILVSKENGAIEFLNETYYPTLGNNLPWRWIYSTSQDHNSTYWFGCMNGIMNIDFARKTSKVYNLGEGSHLFNGSIFSLYRDYSGRLWAGSDKKGLAYFSDSLDSFIPYRPRFIKCVGLENLRINSIMQTEDSIFWIGTSEGLLKIDRQNAELFTEKDQLPNDFVYGVLEDDDGLLWLSTNNGICSFNPKDLKVKAYNVNEGLQDKEFNTGAYYKANSGRLFFGGVNGFNHFMPSEIFQSQTEAPIILTGIKWYNEYIELTKEIVENSEIVIPSNVEYFNIEFAGLNYLNAVGNLYKYKIEEINDYWISLGTKHEIGFHSLKPGTYHLQILASNNHGKWNQETFKLKIIVLASFRETIYFKLLLLSMLIGILSYIVFWRFRRIKSQKLVVEEMVINRTKELHSTNEKLLKANQTKNQFFSIISHDLKNPLGAAQSVSSELKLHFQTYDIQEQQDLLNVMDSAMNNLGKLLANLLTWSQVQQDMIIAKPENLVLRKSVYGVLATHSQNIHEKNIEVEVNISKGIQVFADKDLLSSIIRNLLSNAIKFTVDKGKITISAEVDKDDIVLQFNDTGVGMSEETLKKLFAAGNNISTPGTKREMGTGMGLLLIYDFVKLNNGKIWVNSKEGEGSSFFVSLPRKKSSH